MNGQHLATSPREQEATIAALRRELAATQRGLLELAMELEQRVEDRTTELRAAQGEIQKQKERTERALLETELQLHHLVERARDLIYRYRLVPSRGFEYVSPAAEGLTGYTVAEHYADPDLGVKITHPDDRPLLKAAMRSLDLAEPLVLRWVRKDGAILWVEQHNRVIYDEAGTPVAVEGIARDITDRVRAEEALRESEELYRAVVENLDEATVITVGRERVFVNRAFVEMIGARTMDEALALRLSSLVLPEDAASVHEWNVARSRGDPLPGLREYRVRRLDGEVRSVVASAVPISYHGQPGALGLIRDVTERRHVREALEESNRRLTEALDAVRVAQEAAIQRERLRALGEMASGIAHDFNNTLTPIIGFADILLRRPELWTNRPEVERYLGLILASGQDAARVVARLTDFYRAREASAAFRSVDFTDLVRQTVALSQPRWKDQALAKGASVHVEAQIEPGLAVPADESELREALINLIFNAVDAMPQGGIITIRAWQEGARVMLQVSDTGIGMSEDVRRRCLDPFFTTKGPSGTGLGLSGVYGTVQRHGGTLDIRSAPGAGTCVTIVLPTSTPVPPPTVPEEPEELSPPRPLRVLLVEDEELVREVTMRQLAEDGHSVTTASNGREGLAAFETGEFDLVITDRAMPEMSGDQLARAISLRAPETRVILLTGFGAFMNAVGEQPEGVDLVLGKPAQKAELRAAISRLSGESSTRTVAAQR